LNETVDNTLQKEPPLHETQISYCIHERLPLQFFLSHLVRFKFLKHWYYYFILTILPSNRNNFPHASPNFVIHNTNICGFYFHEACYKAQPPPCPLFELFSNIW